ncbi:MAG: acylphosphatase [Acidimicrobiia bacterium]|nr:acylphosphatase [Acidimicrobiia bacterium]
MDSSIKKEDMGTEVKESEQAKPRAVVAVVSGRVQGVGFRYSTHQVGTALGLEGWVVNQPDGTVRTWAQGAEEAVARFVAYLESGPPAAHVTDLSVTETVPDPRLAGFRVR